MAARRRHGVRGALAALLAGVALAGCGGGSASIERGGVVPGNTLTVVALLPREGPRADASRAISRGLKLALAQAGGRVDRWALNYGSVDAPARTGPLAARTQETLRDISLIATVADLDAASAGVTVPLLNAAGILQISPAVPLAAVQGDPLADPSGRRTFSSLMPGPQAEARALADAARGRVAVEAESGDPAAEALANAVGAAVGETVPTRRAGTVIYTGTDPEAAAGVLEGIARENRDARLLAPQALWGSDLPGRLPEAVRERLRFTTAVGGAPDPGFVAAYRDAYDGAEPASPWAQVGWEAGNRVVAALRAAGPRANVRQAVIDAYFAADPAAAADRRAFRVVRG